MAPPLAFVAPSLRTCFLGSLILLAACAHGADPLTPDDADPTGSGTPGSGGEGGGGGGSEIAGAAGEGVGGNSGDGGSAEPADAGGSGTDLTADGGGDGAADAIDAASEAPMDAGDAHDAGKDSSLVDAGPPPKRPTGVTLSTASVATMRQTPSAGGNPYSDECPQNLGDGGVGFSYQVLVGFKGTVQGPGDGGSPPTNLRTMQGICAPLVVSATAPYRVTVGVTSLLPLRGVLPDPALVQTVTCPANQIVVGFVGRQAGYIEEMQFRCAPLAINGTSPAYTLSLGAVATTNPIGAATAGTAFPAIDCPAGQVAVAQAPRAGSAVDSFGLVCRTPSLVIQ